MKNRFILLIFLSLSNFGFSQEIKCKNDLVNSERKAHRRFLNVQALTTGSNYDLKYHRLSWNVDPVSASIAGSVTSYFLVTGQPFSAIHFDLASVMSVDSVFYHNSAITFTHLNSDVSCQLPANINNGILDSITVHYHGFPPSTGFPASSNLIIEFKEKLPEQVRIADLQGRNVLEVNAVQSKIEVDVSKMKRGTYFLNVSTENGVHTKKIIIGL